MTRRRQLRRRGRRGEWILVGCLAAAAAILAAPLGRLVAGDRGDRALTQTGPTALPAAQSNRAAWPPGKLPVFARLRPDLVAEQGPTLTPSAVPVELETPHGTPGAVRRTPDMRVLESLLDPGFNTRNLPRPGDVAMPEKEAEELRQRVRPGMLGLPAPYKVPFVHTDVIAPQLAPDVEVAVSDRTRLGVFGKVGPAGEPKSVPFPGIINRPLGAGVTLEYRFGTK